MEIKVTVKRGEKEISAKIDQKDRSIAKDLHGIDLVTEITDHLIKEMNSKTFPQQLTLFPE